MYLAIIQSLALAGWETGDAPTHPEKQWCTLYTQTEQETRDMCITVKYSESSGIEGDIVLFMFIYKYMYVHIYVHTHTCIDLYISISHFAPAHCIYFESPAYVSTSPSSARIRFPPVLRAARSARPKPHSTPAPCLTPIPPDAYLASPELEDFDASAAMSACMVLASSAASRSRAK